MPATGHVGFYGGIHYGFGYGGDGFVGGRWDGNRFAYNRAVSNVSGTVVRSTYTQYVARTVTISHVSYNGGRDGMAAMPTERDRASEREAHLVPTELQRQHVHEAARNPALFVRANGGHPGMGATAGPAAVQRDFQLERPPAGALSSENAKRLDHEPNEGHARGVAPAAPQMAPVQPPTTHAGPAAVAVPPTSMQRSVGPMQRPQLPAAPSAAQPMSRALRPDGTHATPAANAVNPPQPDTQPKDRPKNEPRVGQP